MDSRAARYAATVRVQTARTEVIADLGGMVIELLRTFYQTVHTCILVLVALCGVTWLNVALTVQSFLRIIVR